jgi:hypothetical protein
MVQLVARHDGCRTAASSTAGACGVVAGECGSGCVLGGVWCSWWRVMTAAGLLPAALQVRPCRLLRLGLGCALVGGGQGGVWILAANINKLSSGAGRSGT